MMALAVVLGLLAVALAARWLLNAPVPAAGRIVVAKSDIDGLTRAWCSLFGEGDAA